MRLDLKSKLLFLVFVLTIVIVIFSAGKIFYDFKIKTDLAKTKKQIQGAQLISLAIDLLQREREHTAGLPAAQKNQNHLKIRAEFDTALNMFSKNVINEKLIIDLKKTREFVDNFKLSSSAVQKLYSSYMSKLLEYTIILPTMIENKKYRNHLQAYSYLALAKEQLGRIRATLYEVLASKTLSEKNLLKIQLLITTYRASLNRFENTLNQEPELLSLYFTTIEQDSILGMLKTIDVAVEGDLTFDAVNWFTIATQNIDLLQKIEERLFEDLQSSIEFKIENARQNILYIILSLAMLLLIFIYLMRAIVQNILYLVHLLNEKFKNSLMLLEQYKLVVDENAIVSKTDKNGILTYVNEKFCKISGYEESELLGKAHNIVNHPDMPKEVFTELWHTIKYLKQPWIGEIKSLKKNGTAYWATTFIKPILNANEEVVEYIAIRTDTTQIIYF